MCAASEIAQRNTSPSPRRLKPSLPPDKSQRPTIATPAATHAITGMCCRRNTAPSTGVSTTNSPVMKPVFEAVVCSRPSVWNT